MMMIRFFLRKKRFLFSALFLITLVALSIGNTIFNNGEITQIKFLKDENGNFLKAPPFPPLTAFILGSDRFGYDLGQMMIEGAKYTIGITLFIALSRIFFSILFSSFIYTLKPRFFNGIQKVFEPFSIIPQTIIAYFILFSVLWMPIDGFEHPFWQRALFEVFVLVIIALPNLTIHLSKEMRLLEKETFIEAARTLGGSKYHIFLKHMVPNLYEKWILLFGQQFMQSIQLLAHLGFLKLFFGGTFMTDEGPPRSISFEWSGLIGDSISYLHARQWIILVPIAFFVLTAISVALINDTIKEYFHKRQLIKTKEF